MVQKVLVIGIILEVILLNIVGSHESLEVHDTKNKKTSKYEKGWTLVDNYYRKAVPIYESLHSVSLDGDSFELDVYVNNVKAELLITLTSEDNEDVLNYVYNGSREESESWNKLVFPVHNKGVGYIHLLGYSDDKQKVLIDSLYYEIDKSKNQQINDEQAAVLIIYENNKTNAHKTENQKTDGIDNANNIYFKSEEKNINEAGPNDRKNDNVDDDQNVGENDDQNVGEDEDEENDEEENKTEKDSIGEEEEEEISEEENKTKEDKIEEDNIGEDNNVEGLLSTWIIILIVVASVTVVAIVAAVAYYLGFNRGLDKNSAQYFEDVEPARVFTIPRVKGVSDSPIGDFM